MREKPGAGRRIHVNDLDPAKAKEEMRAHLLEVRHLTVLAMSVVANGAQVRRPDRLTELSLAIETITIMMDGIASSIASVVRLTDEIDLGIRDCYGIARSICEGSINAAYIMAGGNDVAGRARRHAMQKSYREMARNEDIGGFRIGASDLPMPQAIAGMQEALAEFTRRNGSEITEWSGLSLLEKKDAIVARYPGLRLSLEGSISSLYRRSSELLHGTFAGAELFWSAGGPARPTSDEFERLWVQHHLVPIFTSIWTSVLALLEAIEQEFDVPELGRRKRAWLASAASIFDVMVTEAE